MDGVYRGTLHIGNLCNNNYKLCLALRSIGVDARFVLVERVAACNPISHPRHYDPEFSPGAPWVETIPRRFAARRLQMAYELAALGHILRRHRRTHWVHAQTEYPGFASLFTGDYSAHSTGSDLREEYAKGSASARLLKRGYDRARVVFFNNIDLYRHPVGGRRPFVFLPNAVDVSRFRVAQGLPAASRRLRLLNASRITLFDGRDLKGNAVFWEALQEVARQRVEIDLVLAAEDPESPRLAQTAGSLAPTVRVSIEPYRNDRALYLRQISAADLVIDQFGFGAMGGTSLDCYAMGRIALVHNDPLAFEACYGSPFLLGPLDSPKALADAIVRLAGRQERDALAAQLRSWLGAHHGHDRVARHFLGVLAAHGVRIEPGTSAGGVRDGETDLGHPGAASLQGPSEA